jgi:hypothetical protein
MPHTIKLAPEHFTGLRPVNRQERRSLVKVCAAVFLGLGLVAGVWLLQRHWQEVREQSWEAASGTIEDVRPVLVTKVDSNLGGAMLYDVQVLAKYSANGVQREEWITVSQRPERLADEQFQAFRWKGKSCTIRWNAMTSRQIVVEISS